MPATDADVRLGEAIRARRESLGLDIRSAAAAAPAAKGKAMSSSTWNKIETGKVRPFPSTYARIEEVLGWERGSCMTVRDGGTPALLDGFKPDIRVTELTSPGDRLMILAASWGDLDELTQRRLVEIALAAHKSAHGGSQGDTRAAR